MTTPDFTAHNFRDGVEGGTPITAAILNDDEAGIIANHTAVLGKVDKSTLTAKGDLLAASGTGTPVRQPVGTDGQFLAADSTATSGLAYVSSLRTVTLTAAAYAALGVKDPNTLYVVVG